MCSLSLNSYSQDNSASLDNKKLSENAKDKPKNEDKDKEDKFVKYKDDYIEGKKVRYIDFSEERFNKETNFFGGKEINPEEPDIKFSEGPIRRFEITFFISLPIVYLYNSYLFDQATRQHTSEFNTHDYDRGSITDSRWRYIILSCFITAFSIAWSDYENVFLKKRKAEDIKVITWDFDNKDPINKVNDIFINLPIYTVRW